MCTNTCLYEIFFLFGSLEHVPEVMVKVLLTTRDRSRKRKNFNKDMISFSLITYCYVYKPIIMLMENCFNSLVDSLLRAYKTLFDAQNKYSSAIE